MTSDGSSSNNKAIYTALPLLPSDKDDQIMPTTEIASHGDDSVVVNNSLDRSYSLKPFVFGMIVGFACYCLVDSRVVPNLDFRNVLLNSLATALLWSTITSLLAYGIFWATWMLLERQETREEENNNLFQSQEFFEQVEYYFTLGVFLGFCTACTVDVILFGIPFLGVMSMVFVAFLWTLVMLKVAPVRHQKILNQEAWGKALPMLIVFMGFGAAFTVDIVWLGIPLLSIMTVASVACLCAVFLQACEKQQKESRGTNLPMLIV